MSGLQGYYTAFIITFMHATRFDLFTVFLYITCWYLTKLFSLLHSISLSFSNAYEFRGESHERIICRLGKNGDFGYHRVSYIPEVSF
jgi:hypothetical protein